MVWGGRALSRSLTHRTPWSGRSHEDDVAPMAWTARSARRAPSSGDGVVAAANGSRAAARPSARPNAVEPIPRTASSRSSGGPAAGAAPSARGSDGGSAGAPTSNTEAAAARRGSQTRGGRKSWRGGRPRAKAPAARGGCPRPKAWLIESTPSRAVRDGGRISSFRHGARRAARAKRAAGPGPRAALRRARGSMCCRGRR